MNIASPQSSARATQIRWLVFGLSCFTSFLMYLHRYTWNFIGPKLEEAGWSITEVQGVYSLFFATYGLAQIPSGMLCDFFGAHLFLGTIIIVWSLLLPLHAIDSSALLSATRLAFGAAQAGCYPILAKISRAWFPTSYRTVIQGTVASVCGRGGGAMSSIIMGSFLMGTLGMSWQLSLAALAGVGVLFGLLFLFLFRNSPDTDPRVNQLERDHIHEGEVRATSDVGQVMPWGRALRNVSMGFFIVMQFLAAGVDTIYSSLMGKYFLDQGIDIKSAGILASLPLWGGMAGGLVAAVGNDWLIHVLGSRRWGRSLFGIFSNTMACAMMLVTIRQSEVWAAGAGLFAVKFFADMSQPTCWGACTDVGGRRFAATVFAIINTAGVIGAMGCPLLFGLILEHSATTSIVDGVSKASTSYVPLFQVAAAMYIAGAFCWCFVDCTRTLDDPT